MHPNILQCYGTTHLDEDLSMVLELSSDGPIDKVRFTILHKYFELRTTIFKLIKPTPKIPNYFKMNSYLYGAPHREGVSITFKVCGMTLVD